MKTDLCVKYTSIRTTCIFTTNKDIYNFFFGVLNFGERDRRFKGKYDPVSISKRHCRVRQGRP